MSVFVSFMLEFFPEQKEKFERKSFGGTQPNDKRKFGRLLAQLGVTLAL